MSRGWIVFFIILGIFVAAMIVLYFIGRRLQKKQEEQQEQVNANKQPVTLLIIDKKRMKLKDAGLPKEVLAQTPKIYRRSKVDVVRAKIMGAQVQSGQQIMNFICDENIFEIIPVRKQVRAQVAGIYIVEVKPMRGQKLDTPDPKKKNWLQRQMDKIRKAGGAEAVKKK